MTNADGPNQQKTDATGIWKWAALALIIISSAVIRGRLASMPLERDEGEYAYIAQQMLKGVPPYESAYSMKLPGIYVVYAAFLVLFGQTTAGIHTGLIIFNAATILVLYLLARRMFGEPAGVAAAAAYAVTSMIRPVLGLSANAEHFVILPALVGILLLIKTVENRKLALVFISGLLLGAGFCIKQHGIFFPAFASAYLLYCDLVKRPIQWKKVISSQLVFAAAALLPFVLICLLYRQLGLFDKFWFWTFTYARKYTAALPPAGAWYFFKISALTLLRTAAPVWLFALAGLLLVVIRKNLRPYIPFAVGFSIFSFLAVCPGFYFRAHYYIFFLPAASIPAGLGFWAFCEWRAAGVSSKLRRCFIVAFVAFVVVGYTLFDQRKILFNKSPSDACRIIYGYNPFPESVEIADYIKARTSPQEGIAVIGSEPQIYFYSDTKAVTRYIYTYPLMELHEYAAAMQQEMIGQIESARPKFIVFVMVHASWIIKDASKMDIFQWFEPFVNSNYTAVGIIDMLPDGQIRSTLGDQPLNYSPQSSNWIAVFRRKD